MGGASAAGAACYSARPLAARQDEGGSVNMQTTMFPPIWTASCVETFAYASLVGYLHPGASETHGCAHPRIWSRVSGERIIMTRHFRLPPLTRPRMSRRLPACLAPASLRVTLGVCIHGVEDGGTVPHPPPKGSACGEKIQPVFANSGML